MGHEDDNGQVTEEVNNSATASGQGSLSNDAVDSHAKADPNNAIKTIVSKNDMDFLNDVHISITIEIGRTQIKIRDLLNLTKDSIIDLDKDASEPVDVYANGKLISRGKIITSNGKYCVRLMSVTQPVGTA